MMTNVKLNKVFAMISDQENMQCLITEFQNGTMYEAKYTFVAEDVKTDENGVKSYVARDLSNYGEFLLEKESVDEDIDNACRKFNTLLKQAKNVFLKNNI